MIIRDAVSSDIDEIHSLEKRVFNHPWAKEHIAFELNNHGISVVKVLVNDNKIYGYIFVHFVGQEMQILNLAVHPAKRKKGWGKRLLESVLHLVEQKGEAFLEVRRSNLPAISVYKKMGFQSQGLRRTYYADGEDAIIMRKHINH